MRRIEAVVQHYAWGSTTDIPQLLGVEPDGRPWAELWLGTHPNGPSLLPDGRPLAELTGELPFVLKVLAAAEPLSLQVHPTVVQARAGFARGTYGDDRPKPELLMALTPFEALCGFRPARETCALLDALGLGDHPIAETVSQRGPKTAMERLYRGGPAAQQIVEACRTSEHPVAGWVKHLDDLYHGDPSVGAALLLNHVTLDPGEAIRLDPGVPHSYLHGTGIELMGASDNVVRGGLTVKPVDVDDFLEIVTAEPLVSPVLPAADVHDLPLAGAALRRIEAGDRHRASAHELAVDVSGGTWHLAPGETLEATATTYVAVSIAPTP